MNIFEGEELRLHYHKAESDYIIISYTGADEIYKSKDYFFLKPIAEDHNISCLGICSKQHNHYYTKEMSEVIRLCNEITKNYKKIIIIGPSVGGYAALKYSKLLNADVVLALAPRATLNADICPISNKEFVATLTQDEVKNSTIQAEDIKGDIYIAYDPFSPAHWLDKEHIGFLLNQIPQATPIYMFFAEHPVIAHMQGSVVFKSIIDALVQGNKKNVIKTISYIRRHHIASILTRLYRYKEKYPFLLYKMLTSAAFAKVRNNDQLLRNYRIRLRLCYCLQIKGYHQESSDYLKSIFFYHMQNIPYDNTKLFPPINPYPYPYLINFNGFYLCYNFITKKLESVLNISEKPNSLPLQLYRQNDKTKLICIQNGIFFELKYYESQLFELALLSDNYTFEHVQLKFSGDKVFIHTIDKKHYIGINQVSTAINYSATIANDWEAFAAIPMTYSSKTSI